MKKTLITLIWIIGISLQVSAQDKTSDKLRLFAKQSPQGTMLKVIPQTAKIWLEGVEHGYHYYRKEVGAADFELLNKEAIRPLKDSGFEQFEKGDSLMAFNQKAVFTSLNESKVERSPSEAYRYVQQRDQEFAFYILVSTRLRDISMISGMEYLDLSAEKGKAYVYKVELANEEKPSRQLYLDPTQPNGNIPMLEGISEEKSIQLAWQHQPDGNVLCYHLERAEDGKNFTRLNEAPIYPTESGQELFSNQILKQDSVAQNYQSYAYRLIGLDVWGDELSSGQLQYFMAVDKTAPRVPEKIETRVNEEEKSISLSWKHQLSDGDFGACMVYYSQERNGMYRMLGEAIIDPMVQTYTHDSLSEFDKHYYKLVVVDTNQNFATSHIVFAEVPDIYPPAVPQGLKAEVDKEGVVHLKWEANTEKDLRAYMVFRSTNGKNNYLTITPMHAEQNHWVDSFAPGGLNKDVYYYLRAMDRMYNYSDNSDTLRVQLPDTLAPVAARIQKISREKKGLQIKWIPSTSSDFQQQYLLVAYAGQQKDSIALGKDQRSYMYKSLQPGNYQFRVVSTDDAGNKSISPTKELSIEDPAQQQQFATFKAKGRDQKTRLEWDFKGDANMYLVYRSQKGKALQLIASTRASSYVDTNVKKGSSYTYYVKAKDKQGSFVAESSTQKVKF